MPGGRHRREGVDHRTGWLNTMTIRDGGHGFGAHEGGCPAACSLAGVRRRVGPSPCLGDVDPGPRRRAVSGVRPAARLQPRRRPHQSRGSAAVARPEAVERSVRGAYAPFSHGRRQPHRASRHRCRRVFRGPVRRCPHRWCRGRADDHPNGLRGRRRSRTHSVWQPAVHRITGSSYVTGSAHVAGALHAVAGSFHIAGALHAVAGHSSAAWRHAVGITPRGRSVGESGSVGESLMLSTDA